MKKGTKNNKLYDKLKRWSSEDVPALIDPLRTDEQWLLLDAHSKRICCKMIDKHYRFISYEDNVDCTMFLFNILQKVRNRIDWTQNNGFSYFTKCAIFFYIGLHQKRQKQYDNEMNLIQLCEEFFTASLGVYNENEPKKIRSSNKR